MLVVLATNVCLTNAQGQDEVSLSEVSVEAARVLNRPDGQLITPSKAQTEASTNGYSLLSKLGLPTIRVDEVAHTVSALGNQGQVQVRINGVVATKDDLLALDPKSIRNIEFIDKPGVRFGEGIGYVLNLRTRRAGEGYTVGLDATNTLTTYQGDNAVFAKMNRGKSEFGLSYDFTYNDFDKALTSQSTHYLLTDGTEKTILRNDVSNRKRSFGNAIQLKYTLADTTAYLFQASLTTNFDNTPGDEKQQKMTDEMGVFDVLRYEKSRSWSPVLDLYFMRQITSRQSINANLTATHISSNERNANSEDGDYRYMVDGKTWSVMSEAIYENRMEPFTLTAGVNFTLKYTRNNYSGDVLSLNQMHNNDLYLFAEIKGNWRKWNYITGLGASRFAYSQGAHDYTFHVFRPKFTLGYALADAMQISYTFEQSGRVSQIAMVSDTRIRQNSMEWNMGNPDIKPTRRVENSLRLSYSKPRFNAYIDVNYRHNAHPNMAYYERTADNQFVYYQKNQGSIDIFYTQGSARWETLRNHLTVFAYGGAYRFFNRGDDYRHYMTAFNAGGSVQTYLGRWTITANIDNGWRFMEGETWNRQGASAWLSASYRLGNCTLSLYWQYPFEAHPTNNKAGLDSRYIRRKDIMRSGNYGNMISLNLSWKIGKGRKFRDNDRQPSQGDTQTGIMK